MAQYGLNNVPSYDNLKGTATKAHEGSMSHTGSEGCPVHDPGGYTAGAVGSGTPVHLEKGAPGGMEM